MWMRLRAPRLAWTREEKEDSHSSSSLLNLLWPLTWTPPHAPGSSCLISSPSEVPSWLPPLSPPEHAHTLTHTDQPLNSWLAVLWRREVSLSPVFSCHQSQFKKFYYYYFKNWKKTKPSSDHLLIAKEHNNQTFPRNISKVWQTLPCCFWGALRPEWQQWEMLVLALRCCFAEINMAMAPSLWTRMQNNLGQIKPVVFAVIWQPARQCWRLRRKVKEYEINAWCLSNSCTNCWQIKMEGRQKYMLL